MREHAALAQRLKRENYGTALIMPRTWKAALAPFLAGIPERVGWLGEWRFGLLNDLRWGEQQASAHDRPVRRAGAAEDAPQPPEWPLPELRVPPTEIAGWRERHGPARRRAGRGARARRGRPVEALAGLFLCRGRAALTAAGVAVWVRRRPGREAARGRNRRATPAPLARDLTGTDLRNGILALAASDVAVSNDFGLLHVAAALGTPSIGIFGPTSPWHWAPLNPIAATVQTATQLDCQPCHKPTCRKGHHRCMRDIAAEQVLDVTQRALAEARPA